MNSSLTSPPSDLDARRLGLPDIALVGKAGSGKTTAAELLAQLGYRRVSFASPLKSIAAYLWGDEARTDRDKLQRLGVAVREIEADTWVSLAIREVHVETGRGVRYLGLNGAMHEVGTQRGPVVIDDCRFENEWFALKAEGFVIVRVYASGAMRVDRLKSNGKFQNDEQLEHESETAVDHLKPDYVIENNGSTDAFYDRLVDIVIKERRRR